MRRGTEAPSLRGKRDVESLTVTDGRLCHGWSYKYETCDGAQQSATTEGCGALSRNRTVGPGAVSTRPRAGRIRVVGSPELLGRDQQEVLHTCVRK